MQNTADNIIEHDCTLYVTREGDEITVYRSVLVRDTDDLYQPVAELIDGAELAHRETVADENMIFGRAERLIYTTATRGAVA